jgi:hypothetical protein
MVLSMGVRGLDDWPVVMFVLSKMTAFAEQAD